MNSEIEYKNFIKNIDRIIYEKIDIDDLFIKLRTNEFESHYNKVGENVNKKLFKLIKERESK